jgi:tetratricopeptide (TPR) repeat protein
MSLDLRLRLGPKADDLASQVGRDGGPAPLPGADLDPREVLRAFGRAAAREPTEPDYDYLLGCALLRAGEPARAAERCAEAVRMHLFNPDYHFALGCALWQMRRHEEAEASFREAAGLEPRDVEARNARAATLVALGRAAEAVADLKLVLDAAPRFAEAHATLGAALWALDRRLEAVKALRRAARLAPKQADLWRNLGLALIELGRARDAVEPLGKAAALSPGEASARLDLAEAAFEAGRRAQAEQALDDAGRLDPTAIASRPRSLAVREALRLERLRGSVPARPRRADVSGMAVSAVVGAEQLVRHAFRARGRIVSTLLLVAALVLVGAAVQVLPPYVDHFLLRDDVAVVARAPVDDDANVRDRLEHAVRARRMESVVDVGRCEIQSRESWRRITCEYAVPVEILPGWNRVLPFRVDVEQPYVTRPPGGSGLSGS